MYALKMAHLARPCPSGGCGGCCIQGMQQGVAVQQLIHRLKPSCAAHWSCQSCGRLNGVQQATVRVSLYISAYRISSNSWI